MRFTVRQKTLLKEIDLLRSVASRKNKEKISTALRCFRFQVTDTNIILTATDLDFTIKTTCPVESLTTVEEGVTLIPAAKLCDIVRGFEGQLVDFELLEANWMKVSCGRSVYKIPCEAPDRFPNIPYPDEYPASVPLNILLGQITRTEFGIPSEQSTAPKGVYFEISDNVMTMFSVDGNQCPLVKSNILFPASFSAPIPRIGMEELNRILTDVKDEAGLSVGIAMDENHVFFKAGVRELSSKLFATEFPNVQTMFDKFSGDHDSLVALVAPFIKVLQCASVMSDDRAPRVTLKVDGGDMSIVSQSPDGEATEYMKVASDGLKLNVAFDTRFLLPSLRAMKVDRVQMDITHPESPVLLTPVGEENFEWKIIVMPLRAV